MKQQPTSHRRAAAWLFAAAALPFTPSLAQEPTAVPVVTPPPPPVVAPPPPATTAPPPAVQVSAPPATREVPSTRAEAPSELRTTTRSTTRTTRRAATRPAPARAAPAAAEPAPAVAEAAPVAAEPAAPPADAVGGPVPAPVQGQPAAAAGGIDAGSGTFWLWILAGAALLVAAIFLLFGRRRRSTVSEDHYHEEAPRVAAPIAPAIEPQPYVAPYVAPTLTPEPERAETVEADAALVPAMGAVEAARQAAADATPAVETIDVGAPAPGDVAAMTAASEPEGNRPWLEMLMRPLRAGTTSDDAVVEFELTVGNTGSVTARDVRISTWMFPAGAEGASEMERMLINSEPEIDPGDGTRVAAAIALPKAALSDAVLPVVVADARYRLPDGSEGRTAASFAVGMPRGDELAPFPVDRSSGLLESVEARLHGDLERD